MPGIRGSISDYILRQSLRADMSTSALHSNRYFSSQKKADSRECPYVDDEASGDSGRYCG